MLFSNLEINLRGHNWVHFTHRPSCCYLEFKLHYLQNLKLLSIRVKELFECIALRKEKGIWVSALLKAFS